MGEIVCAFEFLAEPEIGQFKMSRFEKDVVWFDISVEYVTVMKRTKGIDELPEDGQGFFFWQWSLLSGQIFEGASFTVLIDEIDEVTAFDHFYKFDNVDVIFKSPKGFDLILGQFCEFRYFYEFVDGNHLDCNVHFGIDVGGLVYFTILSFT